MLGLANLFRLYGGIGSSMGTMTCSFRDTITGDPCGQAVRHFANNCRAGHPVERFGALEGRKITTHELFSAPAPFDMEELVAAGLDA